MKNPSPVALEKIHELALAAENNPFAFLSRFSNVGICLACGETDDGVEPDAEGYRCNWCGATAVQGLESALMVHS